MQTKILYCPKCGWLQYPTPFSNENSKSNCSVCNHTMLTPCDNYNLDLKYYNNGMSIQNGFSLKENEQRFTEEVIKTNPEFDPDLYARKDEIIKQKQNQQMAEYERQTHGASWLDDKVGNKPKCPTCGSTNIHPISRTEKVINIGLFGIFGNKRKKQFHCNSCMYEW